MAVSDDDWAGNSVPWNPELPVFEPSHNLLLDAGPWTVPYSDFTPPLSPFALEMRSETIEQLVGGNALRRGESERIEAGRSEENSDAVAGRDRVRVQGTLHEHTGHGLAEQAAHLHTTVDGGLDVHAGNEDMVLLAGHMKDVWDGGTAIVAAMTDDLVAGGGIRVTTPLDLWVHRLMGVEERIGTSTADAVLMELGAMHYEREYGPGVHAVGLARYSGSLYQSNRSSFRPLMRVSIGVRNLIAGGGDEGAGDAPGASPPPAPAAGSAGTEAASETLSAASGSWRTVEAGVEAGARSEDVTEVHRVGDASDHRRVPQEGAERFETQVDSLDDVLHAIGTTYAAEPDDSSLIARTDNLAGLSHSVDSAEQLAALQRGDMEAASLQSIGSPIRSDADDVHGLGDMSRAGAPVPEGDEIPRDPAHFEGYESVPGADIPEPAEIPHDRGWAENYEELVAIRMRFREACAWNPSMVYSDAITLVNSRLRGIHLEITGDAVDLTKYSDPQVAQESYKLLAELATQSDDAGDARRAAEIREALAAVDRLTYEVVTELAARANDFNGTSAWMAKYRRLDPAIDRFKLSRWIREQLDAAHHGFSHQVETTDDLDAFARLALEHSYFSEMLQEVGFGWDPTYQSQSLVAYLAQTSRGAKADLVIPMHRRLTEAMADPQFHTTYAVPGPVREDIADLPLYDHAGDFVHVPGFSFVPGSNSNRVDDVHGAVHAAGVAGSVPEIPRSASAGSLNSSQGSTPPGAVVRMTDSPFEFGFGSLRSEAMHSGASRRYSAGEAVSATPAVGAASQLDARAASWPVLEDAFRLTNDLGFLSGSQRAGEELSNVSHGLDESYVATEFSTFRRIDDAAADGFDEIGPRTGSSSEWEGGRSGTSSGQGGIGFGQAEVEGASPPGRQAGETPGFGRVEPPPAGDVQISDRDRLERQFMKGKGFTVEDVRLLRERFLFGYRYGEFGKHTELTTSMIYLLGKLDVLAKSSELAENRHSHFSGADRQALEFLLSLLDTPRHRL